MKDLTVGKPLKILLLFSLPILIGNLFNMAYNIADTRIIGSFIGNDALAAVGSVSTLNDLLVFFLVGMANGFAVVSATFFGMNNLHKVKKCFSHSLLYGLVITLVLLAACFIFMPGILTLLNVDSSHRSEAYTYICIILVGLLFSSIYNIVSSTLRAIGDVYTPLIFLIAAVCLNIVLDLLFVAVFGLGVAGAGWATVLSQLISAILCFIYTWIKYPLLRLSRSDFRMEKPLSSKLLPAGFSMGLMSSIFAFGTLTLQTAINTLGTNTIVAHAATRKLTSLFMLPYNTLATSIATYTGQNYGAGNMERIRAGLKDSLIVSWIWTGIVILVSHTICPLLITAVTGTTIKEVAEIGSLYQRIDTLFYFLVPGISITRNMLQGLGDHITPIVSSTIELIGKTLIALLLTPVLKYWAIIWSEPIVWILMIIPLIISSYKRLRTPIAQNRPI